MRRQSFLSSQNSELEEQRATVALQIDVSPSNVTNLKLTVDDAPFEDGDEVLQAVPHIVCASSDDYQRSCKRIRTDRGENRIKFTLEPEKNGAPIQRPLTVRVSPEGLSGVNLTVDNAPFQNGDMLDRDRTHVICASAQNYQNHCQRVHLQHEQDTLHIGLVELPRLIPDIIPMTVPHSVTVDGVQSSQWPMHIQPGREYVVCVSADGHEATPRCHKSINRMVKRGPASH